MMAFKPYCRECNTWHTDAEGHVGYRAFLVLTTWFAIPPWFHVVHHPEVGEGATLGAAVAALSNQITACPDATEFVVRRDLP